MSCCIGLCLCCHRILDVQSIWVAVDLSMHALKELMIALVKASQASFMYAFMFGSILVGSALVQGRQLVLC
ncbi:17683_t:CDS:2 [Gigaspora rosea]|nr:17683_t:CDS:2 [Gigaspora rosea]